MFIFLLPTAVTRSSGVWWEYFHMPSFDCGNFDLQFADLRVWNQVSPTKHTRGTFCTDNKTMTQRSGVYCRKKENPIAEWESFNPCSTSTTVTESCHVTSLEILSSTSQTLCMTTCKHLDKIAHRKRLIKKSKGYNTLFSTPWANSKPESWQEGLAWL